MASQELRAAGLAQGKVTLKTAAETVNHLHSEATNLCKAGLIKAKEAGGVLKEAKDAIKYGAFEAWVNSECDFSVRTARRYMSIYENWDRLVEGMGPGQMSIVTLEDGIAKLTQIKREQKEEIARNTIPKLRAANPGPAPANTDCVRGGPHEWESDCELPGEHCAKCHEQRPAEWEAADEDDSGDSPASRHRPAEEADDCVAPRRVGGDCLDRLVKILKEAVDLADQAYQEDPSPLRESIQMSLAVAYEDCLKWRRK